jgi:hypothetical protein
MDCFSIHFIANIYIGILSTNFQALPLQSVPLAAQQKLSAENALSIL